MESKTQPQIVAISGDDESLDEFPTEDENAQPKVAWPKRTSVALIVGTVGTVIAAGSGVWLNSRATAASPGTGSLTVESEPAGANVFIDGTARGKTPTTLTLVEGKHQLRVQREARNQEFPVSIKPNNGIVHHITWPSDPDVAAAAAVTGSLRVVSDAENATVSVDSIERGAAPLTVNGLTVGQHDIAIRSGGSVRHRTLRVEANTTTSLVLTGVETGTPSGWLTVTAGAPLRISENGKLVGTSESDRIMLPVGEHSFDLSNDALGFAGARTIKIVAGQTASLTIPMPRAPVSLNAIPWAQVWVDGQALGATPIGDFTTSIGTHEVVFRHPQLGERKITALVTLKEPARVAVDMTKR